MTELSDTELAAVVGGVVVGPASIRVRADAAIRTRAAKEALGVSMGKDPNIGANAAIMKALDDIDTPEIPQTLEAYRCGIGTRLPTPLARPMSQSSWPRECPSQMILG